MRLYPFKLTPAYRYGEMTPWGGGGLRAFGKDIPDPRTGESLEASVLPGLESRDEEGTPLSELLRRHGDDLRGARVGEAFPLLLKLISADDMLSVQVHPDDAYARENENGKLGKTEAWAILSAQPGAEIVYGVKEGVTREMLARACEASGEAVKDCLNFVKVKPGEVYYLPAGMVHALGGGVTLMEIQESSDVTYRFYDWDRRDASGNARPLHIKKGLDVTDVSLHLWAREGVPRAVSGGERTTFIQEAAFTLERWRVDGRMDVEATPEHFRLLLALGAGRLVWEGGGLSFDLGDTVFLPANAVPLSLEGETQAYVCW